MTITLVNKLHETSNIWSFRFSTPPEVSWHAGQSLRIEVPRSSWGYNEKRFTIASLTTDGYLQITTRLSNSEFKQDLDKLTIGHTLNAHGIEGKINWGDLSRTKVLIAGGTGVTLPYIAIRQAEAQNIKADIMLIYSTKDQPPLFIDYLTRQAKASKIQLTTSHQRLTAEHIISQLPSHGNYDLNISGPDEMYRDLHDQLRQHGISNRSLEAQFLQ
ncbi:FAD-dependent oxidoreductase [Candidatus Saccharibacteria bacterium]|nr:FAD-dependent oxidoreductase [Candidatus Saccharibacteria bacterium]